MHITAKDGLTTVTLTEEEWSQLSNGLERAVQMSGYREMADGCVVPAIDTAECIVFLGDELLLKQEACQ